MKKTLMCVVLSFVYACVHGPLWSFLGLVYYYCLRSLRLEFHKAFAAEIHAKHTSVFSSIILNMLCIFPQLFPSKAFTKCINDHDFFGNYTLKCTYLISNEKRTLVPVLRLLSRPSHKQIAFVCCSKNKYWKLTTPA